LCTIDPLDDRLIKFNVEKSNTFRLPPSVKFKILVSIKNIIIHRCIIDEGESTCIMSTQVWKQLGLPYIFLSTISLHAYDGSTSHPEGLYHNFPIQLVGKKVLIDFEVLDVSSDYNILLCRSFMYTMKEFTSSFFNTMIFPHRGKIVTIYKLTYHDPKTQLNRKQIPLWEPINHLSF